MMKKAREIEIPADRPLSLDEFTDFRTHAFKSSSWYATEYLRSEQQIIDKLLRKGYTREDVNYLDKNGVEHSFNIIDEVITKLREYHLVNDDSYARTLIERYSSSGRGRNYTRNKLVEKGIQPEVIDDLLDELIDEDETFESVNAAATRYMNTSSYRREENHFKQKQKLTAHLISRGFTFDDIRNWEDQREE